MWRFCILTFAVLFFSAKSIFADKVIIEGGGGHPHHNHGHYRHGHSHGLNHGFAYRDHWHHRGWGHVSIAPEFSVYLGPLPYRGAGYQLVTVYFDDGSRLNNVYVYNHDQIEIPPDYSERRITRVVVED